MEAVAEHNKNNKLDALAMHHTETTTENVRKKARTNENVAIAVAEMNLSIPKIPPTVPEESGRKTHPRRKSSTQVRPVRSPTNPAGPGIIRN